jgi:hypothetical protein
MGIEFNIHSVRGIINLNTAINLTPLIIVFNGETKYIRFRIRMVKFLLLIIRLVLMSSIQN